MTIIFYSSYNLRLVNLTACYYCTSIVNLNKKYICIYFSTEIRCIWITRHLWIIKIKYFFRKESSILLYWYWIEYLYFICFLVFNLFYIGTVTSRKYIILISIWCKRNCLVWIFIHYIRHIYDTFIYIVFKRNHNSLAVITYIKICTLRPAALYFLLKIIGSN